MFIPGRIEIIGKHTDYCGGQSIVCAIDRGFSASFRANDSNALRIMDSRTGSSGSVPFAPDGKVEGPEWMVYPATVVQSLLSVFPKFRFEGLDLEFESDLPMNAGLSSSSAFIVMIFKAVASLNGLVDSEDFRKLVKDDLSLAGFLGGIESGSAFGDIHFNAGVGTKGGSQDHVAILCSQKNTLGCFSYQPLGLIDRIEFPADLVFAVAVSGVKAHKTGNAKDGFNRLAEMVSELVQAWPGDERNLREIIEGAGMDETERFIAENRFSFSTQEMTERLRHFYAEHFGLVREVLRMMTAGDFRNIGGLIDISQRNTEKYLRNQTNETVFLQRSARQIGCLASSAFGAGFGGSVYALVRRSESEEFIKEWKTTYHSNFEAMVGSSEFFTTNPSELSR